ncbi:MAG: hypothetical protein PHV13_04365 [Candidatus ainarchaeum sp.]|nr:hypothetical protein [Candidatus ainarchaeum sp.]
MKLDTNFSAREGGEEEGDEMRRKYWGYGGLPDDDFCPDWCDSEVDEDADL